MKEPHSISWGQKTGSLRHCPPQLTPGFTREDVVMLASCIQPFLSELALLSEESHNKAVLLPASICPVILLIGGTLVPLAAWFCQAERSSLVFWM